MLPTASQVAQDILVCATGIFKSVGKWGQSVKGSLLVYGFGNLLHNGREPAGVFAG